MIKVITQNTEERYLEMEEKYQEYLELYYNTTLPIHEIRKQLEISPRSQTAKYIQEKMSTDNYTRGCLIRKGEWLQ